MWVSENMACSAVLFSVSSYLLFIHLLVFPSLPQSFYAVCIEKFSLVVVWETACHHLCDFFFYSAAVSYTMRKCAGTSKWVTPHDVSFGEEVLGYLQERLSDVESESECTIESDHNTECAEAE
jgi:hypothetical protein